MTTILKEYLNYDNYFTATMALYLSNNHENDQFVKALAETVKEHAPTCQQVKDKIWTIEEAQRFNLADLLKAKYEMQTENLSITDDPLNPFGNLLSGALNLVNWSEIAATYFED